MSSETTHIRVYTHDRDALLTLLHQMEAETVTQRGSVAQALHRLIEDCRPDLLSGEPSRWSWTVSEETRVRVRDLGDSLGLKGETAFDDVILHLLRCCYPDLHGPLEE